MAQCKDKGCTGHARKGQFYCYDYYTAWLQGGDDAVAARIAEMTKHTAELAELRAPAVTSAEAAHRETVKHPSAKKADEAETLRYKIALLEGRLSLAAERAKHTLPAGPANLAILAALIVGAALSYYIR